MARHDPVVDAWFAATTTRSASSSWRSLPDPAGLLEGEGDVSRVAKFAADDLERKREALQEIVRARIAARDAA